MSYILNIAAGSTIVIRTEGSLALATYAAREAKHELEDGVEYSATLVNTETAETLASVAGDADVIGYVLTRRLAKLRKAEAPAAE